MEYDCTFSYIFYTLTNIGYWDIKSYHTVNAQRISGIVLQASE